MSKLLLQEPLPKLLSNTGHPYQKHNFEWIEMVDKVYVLGDRTRDLEKREERFERTGSRKYKK